MNILFSMNQKKNTKKTTTTHQQKAKVGQSGQRALFPMLINYVIIFNVPFSFKTCTLTICQIKTTSLFFSEKEFVTCACFQVNGAKMHSYRGFPNDSTGLCLIYFLRNVLTLCWEAARVLMNLCHLSCCFRWRHG